MKRTIPLLLFAAAALCPLFLAAPAPASPQGAPAPAAAARPGLLDREPRLRDPASLRPGEFVRVVGDHLERGDGRRVRYWGAQGNLVAQTHADIDREVALLKAAGFNLHRLASHRLLGDFTPGDNGPIDRFLYMIAACGRAGIDLWMTDLGTTPTAAEVLAGNPDAPAEWKAAMGELAGASTGRPGNWVPPSARWQTAAPWDPRLRDAWKGSIRRVLAIRNPYTGLTLAEEPSVATWEVTNEYWWVAHILWGDHLKMPAHFQKEFQAQWCRWLLRRYGSAGGVRRAWGGLLPGEDPAADTVLMVPLARVQKLDDVTRAFGGQHLELMQAQIGAERLPERRGRDVIAFLTETLRDFKADLIREARAQGRPGIGIAVQPIVADTEHSGSTVSLWQNAVGDATTVSLYLDSSGGDPNDPRYPWVSGLTEPPVLNDWFDDKRVRGKPTFLYEGMLWHPQKYRAEYAWRLMAQAAVQDFSIIDFHYWGHPLPAGATDATPLRGAPIPAVTPQRLPDGLIFRADPVHLAAMHAAGAVFRRGYLKPAPDPVTVVLGSESLTSFANKGDDPAIRATAFRRGLRYDFDPSAEKDRVASGALVDPKAAPPSVVRPTAGLAYDAANGRMLVDVPEAKAAVGFLGESQAFAGGVRVRDIRVVSPPGMPFVIPGERYAAISLVSLDGKPLDRSSDVLVTAVNTAWNTGFALDASRRGPQLNSPQSLAKAITSKGTAPLLEGRVGCVIEAAWLKGRTAVLSDRFGVEIGRETLATGRLVWSAEKPVFEIRVVPGGAVREGDRAAAD